MYIKTTRGIKITAMPYWQEKRSDPAGNHYVWSYTIRIENLGADTVQLQNRYWCITNGLGHQHEVHGEGVIGEKPLLKSGETFEYTSGAALITPSGIMSGHYQMQALESGEVFEVEIPAFSLDSPYQVIRAH